MRKIDIDVVRNVMGLVGAFDLNKELEAAELRKVKIKLAARAHGLTLAPKSVRARRKSLPGKRISRNRRIITGHKARVEARGGWGLGNRKRRSATVIFEARRVLGAALQSERSAQGLLWRELQEITGGTITRQDLEQAQRLGLIRVSYETGRRVGLDGQTMRRFWATGAPWVDWTPHRLFARKYERMAALHEAA